MAFANALAHCRRLRSRSLQLRRIGWCLLLPMALVASTSACTVVGAGVGRAIDESKLAPLGIAAVSDSLAGRRILLQLSNGDEHSGRLRGLMRSDRGTAVVVERKPHRSLFRRVDASSDTVMVSSSDSLYVGGEPGNGMGFGVMIGVGIDVFLLSRLWQNLDEIVLN